MNETKTIHVAWAVEFGASAVRRVRLTRTPDGYCADHYAEAPLPARWATAPDLIAAAGCLPAEEITDPLVACLGNDLVLYQTIQLPRTDDATREKMIHSQLETLLPAQVEKFAVAWKTQTDPAEANLQHVLLAAVRREFLASVSSVCARWRKGGADVTPSLPALANAWAELSGTEEPVLLMDIGARSTAMAMVQGKRVWRCAVENFGGDAWTERIAKSLGISCEEAERRKFQAAEKDDPSLQEVLDETFFTWTGGLKEVYDDGLVGMSPEAKPARCVMFGRGGRLAGVAQRVSKTLGIPADVARTPDTLRLEEGMALDSVGPLLGAAIGAMQDPSSMICLARGKEDKPALQTPKRRHWAAAACWLLASVAALYTLDLYEASHAEEMVDGIYRETYHQGGLTRQQAVGDYLENGAPVPLDVLERITRAAPDSTILTSLTYARSGLIGLQGSVANEKEYQDFLKKFTELGRTDPRRAWPDNDKFRFELNLTFTGSFGASNKPATQPASAPAIAPATQPSTSPATQPAPSPVTAPAVAPVVPEASPMITPAPSPMFGPAPASQPASQPTGGAA